MGFTVVPASIETPPVAQAVTVGGGASFTVTASGTAPLSYQWRKDGNPLVDDDSILGATTATLTINPVVAGDAGSYDVVLNNVANVPATSAAAVLTVTPPAPIAGTLVWNFGTAAAALHHGLTLPKGAPVGIKGGWLAAAEPWHAYTSEMAQNFWTAIWAFCVCFAATIVISFLTRQSKTDADLTGLVYTLTPRPREGAMPWWKTPEGLGALVMALAIVLNVIFW